MCLFSCVSTNETKREVVQEIKKPIDVGWIELVNPYGKFIFSEKGVALFSRNAGCVSHDYNIYVRNASTFYNKNTLQQAIDTIVEHCAGYAGTQINPNIVRLQGIHVFQGKNLSLGNLTYQIDRYWWDFKGVPTGFMENSGFRPPKNNATSLKFSTENSFLYDFNEAFRYTLPTERLIGKTFLLYDPVKKEPVRSRNINRKPLYELTPKAMFIFNADGVTKYRYSNDGEPYLAGEIKFSLETRNKKSVQCLTGHMESCMMPVLLKKTDTLEPKIAMIDFSESFFDFEGYLVETDSLSTGMELLRSQERLYTIQQVLGEQGVKSHYEAIAAQALIQRKNFQYFEQLHTDILDKPVYVVDVHNKLCGRITSASSDDKGYQSKLGLNPINFDYADNSGTVYFSSGESKIIHGSVVLKRKNLPQKLEVISGEVYKTNWCYKHQPHLSRYLDKTVSSNIEDQSNNTAQKTIRYPYIANGGETMNYCSSVTGYISTSYFTLYNVTTESGFSCTIRCDSDLVYGAQVYLVDNKAKADEIAKDKFSGSCK